VNGTGCAENPSVGAMLAFQSNISGSVIGIFAMGIFHGKNISKYGPLPMEIASAKKYFTKAMNKGFYAAPRELVNMMTNMWVPYDYSAVVQLLIHASTLGDPKAEHYLRDEIKKHLYQEEVREKCESQRKEENALQTAYENHVRMYCTSVLVGDEASGSVCGRNVGSASAWDGAGASAGASAGACWNGRDDASSADASADCDGASSVDCDGAVGTGWDGTSSAVGDDACGSNVDSAYACIDDIDMGYAGDGIIPIFFKIKVRKEIGDRGIGEKKRPLTDPLLNKLYYYNGSDADTEILLNAWRAPQTPLVLKCLIGDALYKYKREKELGPLPDFYIPPQKQKHPHPQKKGDPTIREFVDCQICQNRRGGCNCCTSCYNRNGECTCGKQCTVNQHKCCTCTGCGNNLCNCTCRVLEFLSLWSLTA